ncbi:MAG: hypothetical protein ABI766_14545 [Gemmatimonadales bacterium]
MLISAAAVAAMVATSFTQVALGAGPVTSGWQAQLGTSGANGSANVSAISTGVGSIGLKLVKLKPASTVPVVVYKGTCASVGALLFKLASIKTTTSGAASRTSALTTAQARALLGATQGTGKVAIRVGTGTSSKCGAFVKRSRFGPEAVVQAFYNWYVTDTNWNHLLVRPDLTPGFVALLKQFDGAANPIVCAQDYPDKFAAGAATMSGSSATVKVTSVLGNPTVKLTLGPAGWRISAVDCGFAQPAASAPRPDGRVRLASHGYPGKTTIVQGPFLGDDMYNATATGQAATVDNFNELERAFYTFDVSIQNDGSTADAFEVKATGTASTGWTVTYFRGTTNITSAVVAGTYETPPVLPGATYVITARITVDQGGDIVRLVTIQSVADATKVDSVKFAYKQTACGC